MAEAFAQALARGGAIRQPRAWVWKAAVRIASGQMQDLRRRGSEAPPERAADVPTPTVELLDLLRDLSRMQRAAVVLHYYAGYPLREAAALTGSTAPAMAVHLRRARTNSDRRWRRTMPEIRELLRRVDETPAPDVWDEATRRQPRPLPSPPIRNRIVAAVVALVVAAVGIGLLVTELGSGESATPIATGPSSSVPSGSSGPIPIDVPANDGPPQTAALHGGRLVVEAPEGELAWLMDPTSCEIHVRDLAAGTGFPSMGGGCSGPYLGVSIAGTTWDGRLLHAVNGSTVPDPGWTIHITLNTGDSFDVVPLDGRFMAVIYACDGGRQVVPTSVSAVDPSGAVPASVPGFQPLPPPVDPCNWPTPSPSSPTP